jgi:hypothetical protein
MEYVSFLWFDAVLTNEERARRFAQARVRKTGAMCKFWVTSYCRYGDTCKNRHVYDESKMELCEYYQVGACKKSEVRLFFLPHFFFFFLESGASMCCSARCASAQMQTVSLTVTRTVPVSTLDRHASGRQQSGLQVVRAGILPPRTRVQEKARQAPSMCRLHVWLLFQRSRLFARPVRFPQNLFRALEHTLLFIFTCGSITHTHTHTHVHTAVQTWLENFFLICVFGVVMTN